MKPGHLFEKLANPSTLTHAWQEVLGHYTEDRLPPQLRDYQRNRNRNIERLAEAIWTQKFLPEPAALISIPKPDKPLERRTISLVSPDDRIVLTALNRLLEPHFERQFLPGNYAYRKGRGPRMAIQKVEEYLKQGRTHTASGDIHNFFDNIPRAKLLDSIRKAVWEQPILQLLETYLHMGAIRDHQWQDAGRGVAQGSPLSPLLSNICLLDFDRLLARLGIAWLRYADNLLLLADSPTRVATAFEQAERYLQSELGLSLNPESRQYRSEQQGFEFLGFLFHNGSRQMSEAKLQAKKRKIEETLRAAGRKIPRAVEELSESIVGWRRYYGAGGGQLESLEQHLLTTMTAWLKEIRSPSSAAAASSFGLHPSAPPATAPGTPRLAELQEALASLELPLSVQPVAKRRWITKLLRGSRPDPQPKPATHLSQPTAQAIEQRKREYARKREELSEILIAQPGYFLGRTGQRLTVRRDGKRVQEVPLGLVRHITLLSTAGSVSVDLMEEAASRGIPLAVPSRDGSPAVLIQAPDSPVYQLSLAQTQLASSPEGLSLARQFVLGKIRNQANLLRYLHKYRSRRAGSFPADVAGALESMLQAGQQVESYDFATIPDLELWRGRLFAAEGRAASAYWSALASLLGPRITFEGRTRQGAKDPVNMLLNYGYGILYSRLLRVLSRTGLNVTIGFLHKAQDGKPALLFDFIEEFRAPVVDRAVLRWLNLGKPAEPDGDSLPLPVRQGLSREITHRLAAETRYHGERLPLYEIAERQARRLVQHVSRRTTYQSFVFPW